MNFFRKKSYEFFDFFTDFYNRILKGASEMAPEPIPKRARYREAVS